MKLWTRLFHRPNPTVSECVNQIRNASISTEGAILTLKTNATTRGLIQAVIHISRENRKIQNALTILKGEGL